MNSEIIFKLNDLYKRYGYELKNSITKNSLRVYTLSKGVYFGADIISFEAEEVELEKTQDMLSRAGFGCRTIVFKSIEDVERLLFGAFFRTATLKDRLKERYQKFAYNRSELLKAKYEYINAPYLLENNEGSSSEDTIITSVLQKLDDPGANLIIIEAAAGFGKTCTSYELVNQISKSSNSLTPIFTELSRDRRAAIFKHILDDVIINEFHSLLDEQIVIHEIQSGRIPLIIDGFDELLSKEQDRGTDDFEQVETMLSTIGELLSGNAKIIITGRKTAIFSGDSFSEWISDNPNEFRVYRYLINPPRIKDWLSIDQLEKINQNNIPIREIANPVLLAFIRSLDTAQFDIVIKNPDKLVDKYFQAILDREQERQDLRIDPSVQLEIYGRLAKRMMDFDITSDTKDWIKQLIEEQNRVLLEDVRKSYPVAQRPTLDEMTNTLSNHALLDRKGNNDNIGFINDFIFGTLLGNAILQVSDSNLKEISKHMFELASTAYQFQSTSERHELLVQLQKLSIFSDQERLLHEYLLNNGIKNNYIEATFSDFSLTNVEFSLESQFEGCVFANCTFNDSFFASVAFPNSSFVNCVFKNCVLIDAEETSIIINLINCIDYDSGFIEIAKSKEKREYVDTPNDVREFLKNKILQMYFKKGNNRPRYRKMSLLINAFSAQDREVITDILQQLQQDHVIKVNGDNSFLTDEGIKLGQEAIQ